MKGIGVIKKLSTMLLQYSLITIYKAFVRPHLDYSDIFYDQPNNESLCHKLKVFNTKLLLPLEVSLEVHLR